MQLLVAEDAADGAFVLFRDDQAHPLHAGGQLIDAGDQFDGTVRRHHPPPIQKVAFQQPADQHRVPQLVQNVLGSQGEPGGGVGIGENFFHFL